MFLEDDVSHTAHNNNTVSKTMTQKRKFHPANLLRPCTFIAQNRLFFVGGYKGSKPNMKMYSIDLKQTDVVYTHKAKLPSPLVSARSVYVNDNIYALVGGSTNLTSKNQ